MNIKDLGNIPAHQLSCHSILFLHQDDPNGSLSRENGPLVHAVRIRGGHESKRRPHN
jgi:hypothetical protein